jgi:hypothetical protein
MIYLSKALVPARDGGHVMLRLGLTCHCCRFLFTPFNPGLRCGTKIKRSTCPLRASVMKVSVVVVRAALPSQ